MKQKLAYIEGWFSIALNVVLFLLKYYAGIVSGSIAVIADAWYTLSDSLTSAVVVISAKVASKDSDKNHPFGYGRFELIASIIIGVLLAVAGGNFILESVEKLRYHQTSVFRSIVFYVFAVSAVLKEGIAWFSFWAAKKTGSRSLRSDGWHHRSDALASLLVLAGLIIGRYFWWVDGVLGIIIGVLIIYTGFKIIKDDVDPLLGEAPDDELIKQIKRIIFELEKKDYFPHHYHIHNYGDHTELTFHIRINGHVSVRHGYDLIDKIENAIFRETGIETTIQMEPRILEGGAI